MLGTILCSRGLGVFNVRGKGVLERALQARGVGFGDSITVDDINPA